MKTPQLGQWTLVLLTATVAGAASAWAHSFPEQQSPAAGQVLSTAPSAVTIRYDAPIEKLFAKLQVLDADGKNETMGDPEVDDDGRTLSVKIGTLNPGHYTVQWSVVCKDTHHTQGSYQFTVVGSGS